MAYSDHKFGDRFFFTHDGDAEASAESVILDIDTSDGLDFYAEDMGIYESPNDIDLFTAGLAEAA